MTHLPASPDTIDETLWKFARYMKRAMGGREVGGEELNHDEAKAKLESLLVEARIDELKHLDSLTYSFMSLGNDFDYSYRQSAIDAHIKELEAEHLKLKEQK